MTKFQKENSQLMEKVERLEVVDSTLRGEYKKVKKALEFIMPLRQNLGQGGLENTFLKGRETN